MGTDLERKDLAEEMYGAYREAFVGAELPGYQSLSDGQRQCWEAAARRAFQLFEPGVRYVEQPSLANPEPPELRTAALLLLGACFSLNNPGARRDQAIPVDLSVVIDAVKPMFEAAGITWGLNTRVYPTGAPHVDG